MITLPPNINYIKTSSNCQHFSVHINNISCCNYFHFPSHPTISKSKQFNYPLVNSFIRIIISFVFIFVAFDNKSIFVYISLGDVVDETDDDPLLHFTKGYHLRAFRLIILPSYVALIMRRDFRFTSVSLVRMTSGGQVANW